ncbi:MAG: hypothetical protein LBB94_06270 [Clostridiales bacterium]|jgi:hypothetical protein|nr:hypothetical protein [Clostridiales bacterium]
MNKKLAAVICLALAGMGASIRLLTQSPVLPDYFGTRSSFNLNDANAYADEHGYRCDFPLEKNPRGIINCYVLKYRPNAYESAEKYAEAFIGVESYTEEDDAYIFFGQQGSVTIDKEINQIHFEAVLAEGAGEPLASDEEAVKIATDFMEKRLLVLIYEEAQVHYDGYTYRISFINRISNLKNYAFSNQITMDNYGSVITVDYFATQYDRVGECQIKSMKDAFAELPALSEDETVLLSKCQLVYIYDDSIIQPAYYFQGNAVDEKTYECFVKAAVF